jgi:hypothetical protein
MSEKKLAPKYASIEDVLAMDTAELVALKEGEFPTEKLGMVRYTALDHVEYKMCKKDCYHIEADPKAPGGVKMDLDEDKLMVRAIIAAVDKDKRSTFTFASKELIAKLQTKNPNVITADHVVNMLLSPGEIYDFAVAVQDLSGLGSKVQAETEEEIKN